MRSACAGIAAIVLSVHLLAQGSANARFQFERQVDVVNAGQQRLDVDVALLSGAQPFSVERRGERAIAAGGLGDLRLFATAGGTEVPYLLVPPSADEPVFVPGRVLAITPSDTTDNKTSGFEIDIQAPIDIDAIDLGRIRAPFLKRFRLEGSGDRERWTELIGEGTAFNLPLEQLRHTSIEFEPGPYRYLRVTWDDTHSARVPSPDEVTVRRVGRFVQGPVLRSPLTVTRRQSEPGRSRFRLTLPAARLPIVALELNVAGGNLLRDARVLEAGLVGQEAQPRLLGQTRLTRVIRDTVAADALRIQIAQPLEPQLDLVVDDGDNPALALEGVTAIFAELPWIYFDAPPGALVARYGDPKLGAPRYDLEAERLLIPTAPATASWRAQPPLTLAAEPEGLPMPDTGAAIGTSGFGYVRDLPQGTARLIAVPLDAAAMAHSGIAPTRFRDLRVVDQTGLQIPYLLERRDEPLIVDVGLEPRDLPSGIQRASTAVTSYMVKLPFSNLPDARLALTTRARVFQRSVTVGLVSGATDRQPARFDAQSSHRWIHADQSLAAPALVLPLPDASKGELFLVVEEGDNQPLSIEKVTVLMPGYQVRLLRRSNVPLRLMYGHATLGAPQYDIQLIAPRLMGRAAEEVVAGNEQAMTAAGSPTTFDAVSPVVFWSVLGVTVVVLLALVARLMTRDAL